MRSLLLATLAAAPLAPGPDAPAELDTLVVLLAERADLDTLHDELEAVPRRERAPRVRAELLAHAATTQAELTAWLERNGEERGVTDDEILWAANARTITMPRGPLPELLTGPAYRGSFWASDSAARLEPRAPASARPPAPTRPARPAGLAAAPSPLPLSESFESGSLPTGWTTIQIPGLTSVRIESQATYPSAGTPHDQAHHLVLDSPGAPFDLPGELWVPVAGVLGQGLAVDFAYQVFDAGPGVEFYFGDGTDEWLVTTLPPTSGYATFSIDLGEDALFHDVDLGPNTFLRWRWEGAGPAPGDGFTLDQLEVATTPLGLPFAPLPHLVTLQADQLHQRGVDGTGVLVLAIDNGADAYHKDLVAGRWENPGEVFLTTGVDDDGNGYVDDYIGWNFASDNNKPHNPPHPHGTGTAGLVIGDGTTNHLPTGVAPGAKLAYATVAGIAGHPQSKIAQLSQAYAYAITIGADLTTASIGASELLPLERELLRATMDSVHAAGILSVAAAGNTGLDPVLQVPEKIGSPADCPGPWRHPDQPVVGGLGPVLAAGAFDLGLAAVAPSSSFGPVAWNPGPGLVYGDYPWAAGDPQQPGLIKPDLVGPVPVYTTDLHDGHQPQVAGTSFAAPQVAGVAALLLDLNPFALPRQVSAALQLTTTDHGAPGKDPLYGAGMPRAFEAARRIHTTVTATPLEPAVTDTVTVQVRGPAGTPYFLVLGSALGTTPLGLGADLDLTGSLLLLSSGMLAGHAAPWSQAFALGGSPGLSGLVFHLQVLTDESAGLLGSWNASLVETVLVQ